MDPKHRVYYYVNLGYWPEYERNLDRLRWKVPSLKIRPLSFTPPYASEYHGHFERKPKWHMMLSCLKRDADILLDTLHELTGAHYEKREVCNNA